MDGHHRCKRHRAKLSFDHQKDGTFVENGYTAGVAVDRNGMATGAMGVDVANFRNDDRVAIAIENFANEPSSLFVSRGKTPSFRDESALNRLWSSDKAVPHLRTVFCGHGSGWPAGHHLR